MTKDEIRAILGDAVREDGSILCCPSEWKYPKIDWPVGAKTVRMGEYSYSSAELQAIAAHMLAQEGK